MSIAFAALLHTLAYVGTMLISVFLPLALADLIGDAGQLGFAAVVSSVAVFVLGLQIAIVPAVLALAVITWFLPMRTEAKIHLIGVLCPVAVCLGLLFFGASADITPGTALVFLVPTCIWGLGSSFCYGSLARRLGLLEPTEVSE